jgi:hypothetical protein
MVNLLFNFQAIASFSKIGAIFRWKREVRGKIGTPYKRQSKARLIL